MVLHKKLLCAVACVGLMNTTLRADIDKTKFEQLMEQPGLFKCKRMPNGDLELVPRTKLDVAKDSAAKFTEAGCVGFASRTLMDFAPIAKEYKILATHILAGAINLVRNRELVNNMFFRRTKLKNREAWLQLTSAAAGDAAGVYGSDILRKIV